MPSIDGELLFEWRHLSSLVDNRKTILRVSIDFAYQLNALLRINCWVVIAIL